MDADHLKINRHIGMVISYHNHNHLYVHDAQSCSSQA